MSEFSLVYVTCSSDEEAMSIGEDMVERRYAACVNILPGMTSLYEWNNQFCREQEHVLLLKTTTLKVPDMMVEIKRLHSAQKPAIFALPMTEGDQDFFAWMRKQVLVN